MSTHSFKTFKKNLFLSIKQGIKPLVRISRKINLKGILSVCLVLFLLATGCAALWVSMLKIPDLESFDKNILSESTKIYDKTGEIMLYNVNQDIKRTVIPFDQISPFIKQATVAIEDASFYNHRGIKLSSIIRAVWADVTTGSLSQGGSTITQQVIKNSLLTKDKKISRKIKEWVLSLKLEREADKDTILNMYLNGSPYYGTFYGVQETSLALFGKSAKDVTLAEAAYLAALPQAPGYYSPFGNHRAELDQRKNLVLRRMKELGMITDAEFNSAKAENVTFIKSENHSMKAPHFVEFVRSYLEEKYGEDLVLNGGLKVTTSLNYKMQEKAEETVKKYALQNEKNFNASNAALVAVDPKTGGILAMVGSRDYFDEKIDGNFNVTLAHRQPGSAFKPFAYATAFNKGYTPETILFDVETEFSTTCSPDQDPETGSCYRPGNYDDLFRGPMTMRNALAQSINIPAVKTLYLAGINSTLDTAKNMGIEELGDKAQYGLTLVLGGGEVSPLDITSAYAVFANEGVRNPYVSVLKVEDRAGNVLEEFKAKPTEVLPTQTAREINDVLSDNDAKRPAYPNGSPFEFGDREVAAKTGTTNDYRDAWVIGYTPEIAVGTWAGNNNNSPMVKKVAGQIVAPMWRAFMLEALKEVPPTPFTPPDPIDPTIKPILRGKLGGSSYVIDTSTGNIATDQTPPEMRQEVVVPGYHTILYWVNRDDPRGPAPSNPYSDGQFSHWEYGVQKWAALQGLGGVIAPPTQTTPTPQTTTPTPQPQGTLTPPPATTSGGSPTFTLSSPGDGSFFTQKDTVPVIISYQSGTPFSRFEYHVNGVFIGSARSTTGSFPLSAVKNLKSINTLRVVVYDINEKKTERTITFTVH